MNLEQQIAHMVNIEGVYLVSDKNVPGAFTIMFSLGGKIHAMAPTHELDPNRFLATAQIIGPFHPANWTFRTNVKPE